MSRSSLFALPLLALVACAPTGEESAEPPPEASRQIDAFAAIQHFHAGPSQWVRMGSDSLRYCVLDGVSGRFGGASARGLESYVRILDDGTNFWLNTGVGASANATCVPWWMFNGSSTASGYNSTTRSPFSVITESNDGKIYLASTEVWNATNVSCTLSAIAGQWSGVTNGSGAPWSAALINPYVPLLEGVTNAPEIWANANCIKFPGAPSYIAHSQYALGKGSPTVVTLPDVSTALCGLSDVEGQLTSDFDSASIGYGANGLQIASIHGNVVSASFECLNYYQP
jgi:hypothetical protein